MWAAKCRQYLTQHYQYSAHHFHCWPFNRYRRVSRWPRQSLHAFQVSLRYVIIIMRQNQRKRGPKYWYQSKTIWGVILASVGFFISNSVQADYIQIPDPNDANALRIYAQNIKNSDGDFWVVLGQIMSAAGSVLAIIGRIQADGKIQRKQMAWLAFLW